MTDHTPAPADRSVPGAVVVVRQPYGHLTLHDENCPTYRHHRHRSITRPATEDDVLLCWRSEHHDGGAFHRACHHCWPSQFDQTTQRTDP